jgi:hypothetical protein
VDAVARETGPDRCLCQTRVISRGRRPTRALRLIVQAASMSRAHEITLPSGGMAPDVTAGSISLIGNATVLIRYAGFTVLTDPSFIHVHEQVALGYGLSATRQTNPAVEAHELLPLGLVALAIVMRRTDARPRTLSE